MGEELKPVEQKPEEQKREPEPVRLEPDLGFIKQVSEWGGGDLKTCFQCATCAVVCPLSPDVNPFPRKEVLWAQWGMRSKLVNDPDLWLCHRCNDCSEHCPRGAKTGDVMAALRSYAYQEHATPRFLGRLLNQPLALPLLLAFPALVIWAVIRMGGSFAIPAGEVAGLSSTYWGKMIEPWPWLDLSFIAAVGFVILSFYLSVTKLWQGFMKSGIQPDLKPKMTIPQALVQAVTDILFHKKFAECGAANARRSAHLLIFFGFAGLFVTTALVFIGMYVFKLKTPLPLGHWIKILGNASAIAITIGLVMTIVRRLTPGDAVVRYGRGAYQDVLFLGVLTLVVATGIFSEVFRLATLDDLAYGTYFLHLTFVFFLLFYAPFSKLAHVVYHATTLTWANHVGRVLKTIPVDDRLPATTPAKQGQ
jgi:quinone-modifying oxidoreductase subunit QmoC